MLIKIAETLSCLLCKQWFKIALKGFIARGDLFFLFNCVQNVSLII